MDIANLIISVTSQGLTAAQQGLQNLNQNAQGAAAANKKFGDSIASLNKVAMVTFGALTAVVGGSIKTAIDFEKAMAGVAKTVDFAADNGLANMKKGIEDLTKVIPLAFEELASIAAVGGQLGVAEKDILGFTETIAKMGVAFDIPAEQAADSMAKIAGAFKIPIADIGTLGDSINAVSNKMAATAGDIVGFLSRVGGTSAALKISADNATALGGAMVALGLQPEVAATAFNSLAVTLARFDNLNKTQSAGFQKLGLDTKEFAELAKTDGVGAITAVLEATNKLSSTDGLSALSDAFGVEAGVKIATMATGIDTVKFALDQVGVGADGVSKTLGSMQAEFESVSSTTANKLELTKNNMRLVAAAVGDAFLPAVNELVASMIPFIEGLTAWAKANPELIVTIAKVVAVISGAIIAIAAISGVVGAAISAFTGLSAIFGVAKIAIFALSGPIGLIAIGIGILIAAGLLLYQNWDEIKAKALEVFGGLPAPIQAAIQIVVSVFKTQFEIIKTVVVTVWEVIKAIFTGDWGAIAGIVSNGTSKIGSILKEHFAVILSSFGTVLQSIKSKFLELFGGLPAPVQTALSAIGNIIKGQFQLITTIVSTAFNVVKALFSGEWGKAGQLTMQGLAKINSIVGSMFKAAWELVKVIFTGIGNSIVSILKGIGSKMVQIGRDIINGLANGIRDGASGAVNAARDMAGNVVSSVKNFLMIRSPSRVMKKLGEHTSEGMAVGIKQGAKIVKSEAQKMAEGAIKAVQDGVASLKKEIALLGNDSLLAALDYDISIGKYKGANTDELRSLTQTKENIELSRKLASANDSVQDSVNDLVKQQALFGNNSSLASLMYDIEHTDKYKGVTKELTDKLIEQTAAYEQLGLAVESAELIKERYAQLEKDKQSSANALNSVLGSIEQETPMGKIIADYEDRLAIVATYEQLHTDMLSVAADARLAVEQSYMDAKRDLMLTQGEALFGSLSGMAKSFAGEQSGIYRALFAVEKGFAIAQSAIAIQQSVAKAMALGFPQNIPVIGAAVAQGATLLSTIKGIQPQGFKQGGYTGNGGSGQVAGVVHGQEYVFDAQSTKRIGVDNLNAMRSGKAANDGGDVVINNYSSAKIESRQTADGMTVLEVRDEIKRSWANLSNPNSQESKQINRNVQAPRRRGA